jgi:hypothetical protein
MLPSQDLADNSDRYPDKIRHLKKEEITQDAAQDLADNSDR